MRIAAGLLASTACVLGSAVASASEIDIPFSKTTLTNGLVVILSEDHAVPEVAVNVSYAVGSRMEKPGRTGFAHLFEHLMFMGTEKAPTKAFDAWMEAAGGRNNAWTAEDRTDYFDVAPATALPLLLWLEADRMRNLGPLIDGPKLDLQRDVVLNERRQSLENTPYGSVELALPTLVWPAAHPYHHPVIGSPEDLKAASVEDVRAFFSTFYDPSNASLVVAGDFDPEVVRRAVSGQFGTIRTRGKPAEPDAPAKAALSGIVRSTLRDNVELVKVTLAWPSPAHFAPGDAELDLLASALTDGKDGILYRRLVYERKLAQEVGARQQSHAVGSEFVVEATVRPGVDATKVERALLDEIDAVRAHDLSFEQLERAKNAFEMDFVDRLQSVAERAALLNAYQAERGDPGFAHEDLARYRRTTQGDILAAARAVLKPDAFVDLWTTPKDAAP